MLRAALGEPLPRLRLASRVNPDYALDVAAGRWLLLALLPAEAEARGLLAAIAAAPEVFDGHHAAAFAIRQGAAAGLPQDAPRGLVWLADEGGALHDEPPGLLLLDPQLRLADRAAPGEAPAMVARIRSLPPPALHAGCEVPAPILILPRVFEPALCRDLIACYLETGGEPSGFMRDVEGRTRRALDPRHKVRRDCLLPERHALHEATRLRIARRLAPEIQRVFQFEPTRIERYLVACYDAAEGGHFRAHRDNTTLGTAHRRFAVTINLNAEEYEGGDLVFPEFGSRAYRAPTGGAVVFSCSLLHEARPVTRGRRYAFLPFLYDEAAARLREANRRHADV